MNENYMNEALAAIGSDMLKEALAYKKPKISYRRVAAAAAATVIIGGAAFFTVRGLTVKKISDYESTPGSVSGSGSYDGDKPSGDWNGEAEAVISDAPVTTKGEPITDRELRELIEREKSNIAGFVGLESHISEGICISLKGYTHLDTKDNTISVDRMTLPVFAEGKVIGNVDVFRYEGELHYGASAGGPSWEKQQEFAEEKGGRLAYIWVAERLEYIIAPDDTVYTITALSDDPIKGIKDPYKRYAQGSNTFSLEEVIASGDYIKVDFPSYTLF